MKDNGELISDAVIDAVIEERLNRIKKMVEHNFAESLIMDIFELDESEFEWYYEKLYPFGRFTGPFGPHMEKDVKGRFLKLAGYSEDEATKIIEENPVFFPNDVEKRLTEMFRKSLNEKKRTK